MKKYLALAALLAVTGCTYDNGYYDSYGHYHYYDDDHKKGNVDNRWDGDRSDDWREDDNHDWHNPGNRGDRYYDRDRDYRRGYNRDRD